MSSTYGRLLSNFIALTIIQGTNFLLPLIVMPYVIKRIGAEGFGIISIAHVVMIYFATISDYGFNLTATKEIALHKTDRSSISKVFCVTLVSKMLITLFAFLLLLLLIMLVPFFHKHLLVYLLGFFYVIGQSLLVSWFFQGMEKMQYITIVTLLSRLVFVALVFLFITKKDDHIWFLFFLGTGNILAGLVSIYLAKRIFKLTFVRPLWHDIVSELKEGWQLTISNLSINTYLYTNVFILRLFTNDLVVGYYSIAEKIFFASRQLLGIFSQVIYPRVCQLALRGKAQLNAFFRTVYLPFFLLVVIVSITVFIFSPWVIQLFLSERSDLAILLLQILSFVPIIVSLNIPAFQVLLAFNLKKSYTVVLGLGTIINIVSNLILCNALGAIGTVISIIITELFITIGLNLELYKNKLMHFIRSKAI